VSYQYRAVEKFWRNFYKLPNDQKESVRRAWELFRGDPFHPSLRSHEIHELSSRARHTIYAAVVESDLRVIFRIDGSWVTSLDVGTHKCIVVNLRLNRMAVANCQRE
jgi:hypothetical protein